MSPISSRRPSVSPNSTSSNGILPPIDLLKSCPSPRLLPAASIAYASRSVLTDPFAYADALLYGPDLGSTTLRNEIATWLSSFYEPTAGAVDSNRICITGGASQNLACILQKFTDPVFTRAAWIVSPGFPQRCKIFEDNGLEGKLRFVPEDSEGIDIEMLEALMSTEEAKATASVNVRPVFKSVVKYPKVYKFIIYVMPTFKNPTGTTMSLDRRRELVQLARRFDALIVADEAFDLIRWGEKAGSERPLPRMVDLDRELDGGYSDGYGNAISNASFSKLVAPGCRVGWVEGTEKFVKTLAEVGSTQAGGAPSQLVSTFCWNLLATGTLESHLTNVLLPVYAQRYQTLMSAIEAGLQPLGVKVCESNYPAGIVGGWFLWIQLPEWCKGAELASKLRDDQNLLVAHGDMYEQGEHRNAATGGQISNYLRLCLAWEEEDRLKEGIRRMVDVLKSIKEQYENPLNSYHRHHVHGGIGVRDLLG